MVNCQILVNRRAKKGSIHGFFRSSMWCYDLVQAMQEADEIRVERVVFI